MFEDYLAKAEDYCRQTAHWQQKADKTADPELREWYLRLASDYEILTRTAIALHETVDLLDSQRRREPPQSSQDRLASRV